DNVEKVTQQPSPPPSSTNRVEVIIWRGTTNGGADVSSAFGHVSYIINGTSYSWEAYRDEKTGDETWKQVDPASKYTEERRQLSSGRGYVLDFGSYQANDRFGQLIISAYDGKGGYGFTGNNCGHAFQRALNEMNISGVPKNNEIRPSRHEKFIKNRLQSYIKETKEYPKR
ncbi:MAG: hypothetical protein LC774_05195, partial [Acidobacteria bacterium]|nr:hypothetical protein [Acidobacteriota bacterium]